MRRPFPAYEGPDPYVFVCYAHNDAPEVYREIARLKDAGFNIWYDEGISPGSEWSADIAEHIQGCAAFLYFVSPASVDREYCRREVNFAMEETRSILHVHLEPTDVPPALRLNLSHRQAILKFEYEGADYEAKLDAALRAAHELTGLAETPSARLTKPRRRRRAPWLVSGVSAAAVLILALLLLWNRTAEPAPFDRSVAVELSAVIGSNDALSNFATGLHEDLVAQLSRYQELRTSSAGEPDADRIPASYSLRSSVQALDEAARVRAQLVRTADSQTVWSKVFDESTSSNTSGRLATTIARFVRMQLESDHECESIRRRTTSAEAATYLCEAVAELAKFNQGAGQGDFQLIRLNAEKAIALDPDLVEAYVLRGVHYAMSGDLATAEANAQKALQKWPSHPQLLFHQGYHLDFKHNLDYEAAISTLNRGLEADPLHPWARSIHAALGEIESHRGNMDAALQHLRRSITVFDADARTRTQYAGGLNAAGQPEAALRVANAGLELVSEGFYRSYLLLAQASAYAPLGQPELANRALDEALKLFPQLAWVAVPTLVDLGRTEEAQAILQRLESMPNPSPGVIASVQLALGNDDAAIEWMLKGIKARRDLFSLSRAPRHPHYAALRSHARWGEVLNALAEAQSAEP